MVVQRPSEPEWLSWIWVVCGGAAIFLTVPFARQLQKWIAGDRGEAVFTYIVVALIVLGLVLAVVWLLRLPNRKLSHYLWIAGVAVGFLLYVSQLQVNPIEALHLIEYGLLGILIFRALAHRCTDISIYFLAVLVGALVGTADEFVQWLTPRRFFGYEDIWLDAAAVALMQVGIAKGLTPVYIKGWPDRKSLARIAVWGLAFSVIFGVTTQLTPATVAALATSFPALKTLDNNPNQIIEYGYLYRSPETGTFRSRLSPAQLRQQDMERAQQVAAILDQYPLRADYRRFLKDHPPYPDAFIHEARVHLFRRDRYWQEAGDPALSEDEKQRYLTIARHEQVILEQFFQNTLQASNFARPQQEVETLYNAVVADPNYDSKVSRAVVTRLTQTQMLFVWLILSAVFLVAAFWGYGTSDPPKPRKS